MQSEKNIIYFQDTDTVDNIKEHFKQLNEKITNYEQICLKNNTEKNIQHIISLHEKLDLNLHPSKKSELISILNKTTKEIKKLKQYYLKQKISSFISLIDYIQRKNLTDETVFQYKKEPDGYTGSFLGQFGEQLNLIQEHQDLNPIIFYCKDTQAIELPNLDLKMPLDNIINIIRQYFLNIITCEQFNDYINFKK